MLVFTLGVLTGLALVVVLVLAYFAFVYFWGRVDYPNKGPTQIRRSRPSRGRTG